MTVQLGAPARASAFDDAAALDLRAQVRGEVLLSGDPGYDDARAVRNGLIDRRPAAIVRCSGVADVVACVNVAREHGLLLSVRGGGHNVAGNAVNDGGVVADLSGMRGVWVDPVARRVRVQGGATWGDVDRETQLFGQAAPGGVVSTTGVGGLTLHGGYGHLRRTVGLSIDSLVAVEIVTADGRVRTASAASEPDLFWAVRGAGSNFGAVTGFVFATHPVGPVVQLCAPFYALEDAPRVIRGWRAFVDGAPEAVNSLLVLWSVPDDEHFPEELRGRPIVVVAAVYAGAAADGERVLQPLRDLAAPLLDMSGPIPYTALQAAFDPFFPKGRRYYWKSTYVDDLADDAIDTMVARAIARPSNLSGVTFWHLGGAMARVASGETAYGRRDAPYLFTAEASWTDPATDAANVAWARESLAAMRPWSRGGAYLNFPGFGEDREALLRASFGQNYDRLVELKTRYDPGNLFRMNLNIPPRA